MLKMRIWVQKSASMQKRTSPLKFGDLAEKSGLNSVSSFSTKASRASRARGGRATPASTRRSGGRAYAEPRVPRRDHLAICSVVSMWDVVRVKL